MIGKKRMTDAERREELEEEYLNIDLTKDDVEFKIKGEHMKIAHILIKFFEDDPVLANRLLAMLSAAKDTSGFSSLFIEKILKSKDEE